MNNITIQRDNAADLLKGFAIVLLVMSHVLQFCAAGTGISYVLSGCSGIVELWARSFNMPLFFFVSGLLIGMKPTPNTFLGTGKVIIHKMRTLLLPGVTFMLFRFALSGRWEMEWFLKALFLIIAVFLLVQLLVTFYTHTHTHTHTHTRARMLVLHMTIFVLWISISYFWKGDIPSRLCFHRAAVSYPYLVMGYFYSIDNGQQFLNKHNWVVTVSIILYIVVFYISSYIISGRVAAYLNAYVAAPAAILVCCHVANILKVKQGYIWKALKYCGKHSLSIYLIHMYFMVYCTTAFAYINQVPTSFSLLLQIVFGLIFAIPICAICLSIEYVLSQSKILNLICFGKK